jgi:predicted GNAT superfamily acetyltransferase
MLVPTIDPSAPTPAAEAAAVADDGLRFRRVETLEEYLECVVIQEETWGVNFRERVPTAILMVGQRLSGVCAAAFAPNGRMLGFVFGITGPYRGELAHWSDLLAVRAEARGTHVGERLKRYQRELCRAAGINTIYWTFDPLVARNAHLNLRRLGASASEYVVNMYGSNTGSPLHGTLDTDRWIAAWDLTSPDVHADADLPQADGVFVVRPAPDGLMPDREELRAAPVVRVAVPVDYEALSHPQRVAWRQATRRAFLHYLDLGYRVTTFQRALLDQPPFYELANISHP